MVEGFLMHLQRPPVAVESFERRGMSMSPELYEL